MKNQSIQLFFRKVIRVEKLSRKALKEQYKNRVIIGGVYRIKCKSLNNCWLRATTDMQGIRNRFLHSVTMNSSPEICMMKAWDQFGASDFSFEVIEEIQKKETQTEREFTNDVNTLLELWTEKLNSEQRGEE